ncbi:Spy/CpxP family protein refolding chaperone [Sphaerospermopsis aphanizomenoides BCCUSP55]|uniref:Spy/CpxP family protein refolding chaperone n=1 Tax=Sphaerospermopsis aphanizomenoides TaxID=459663 RepID=UPI0019046D1B|nr:Spy/CpxP family protein refolding chaperone [Sphaerospermopsis aphanizomenoides]MBK1988142.1 Spy/CpxP family protein refolding chaperone [Sphaerospermopsis aphanizomenoides BCCUSP55]
MKNQRMLSIFTLPVVGLAIALLTTGCQLSSPNRVSVPNNSTESGTNLPSSENGTNYPSSSRDINQASEKMSELNLTDTQKAEMKRIREESEAKIFALLSPEQQQELQANSNGRNKLSMKKLRSLNLSTEQKQQVSEITREQRQKIQAILTPEQREMIKQRRRSPSENKEN